MTAPDERYRRGVEILQRLSGDGIEQSASKVAEIAPDFARMTIEFPEYRPYDGLHPEPTLHLTVSADGGPELLEQVRDALRSGGPVEHEVDRISVFARDDDSVWREAAWVPLGGGAPISVA